MVDKNKDLAEPRNVTMYPSDWAVVDHVAVELDYTSTSAALRRIVREWLELKREQNTARIAAGQ